MFSDKIMVRGIEIAVMSVNHEDYISITDILRAKDGDFFVSDWLRNRNTVEFLGIWESVNNPSFNYGEFAIIRSKAGLNSYKISVKEWIHKTHAVGLKATAGRYGGTFAHKDIAFEFGMWISPEFKLYLIKEFQRLKTLENDKLATGWDAKRMLTKINYKIHTDSIKENIVAPLQLSLKEAAIRYANEADVLNKALFGMTAQEWKDANPDKEGNIRDYTDVYRLVVLANLESLNAEYVREGLSQGDRLLKLNEVAIFQMKSLIGNRSAKKLASALKDLS